MKRKPRIWLPHSGGLDALAIPLVYSICQKPGPNCVPETPLYYLYDTTIWREWQRYKPIRRKLRFQRCPICGLDKDRYTGVDCLAVYLDEQMSTPTEQIGATLYLNGMEWISRVQERKALVFDALVVGQVSDHDVEAFITEYTSLNLGTRQKTLRQIGCQILSDSPIGNSPRAMLSDQLAHVGQDFQLSKYANQLECSG